MGKWWHTLISVGVLVASTVTPPVQHFVAGQPVVAVVLGSVWAILGHILPTPVPTFWRSQS